MPENPNAKIPQRTEPAVQPEAPPSDPGEIQQELPSLSNSEGESPSETLEETLSNPATVKAVIEFLKEENLSLDDVEVTEGFWGWSEGSTVASVQVGSREYFISPDSDTTTRLALAMVKQDLEEQPEIFNASFIQSYINRDRLRDELRSDVEEMVRESPDSYGLEPEVVEPEDDQTELPFEGEREPEITDEQIEAKVEEILRDPIEYLRESYGDNDVYKEAIRIAGIDIDEAAEDAVAADGEGHFLSTYDGNINDLPSGGQYWRAN
jgi:hypothetical protein